MSLNVSFHTNVISAYGNSGGSKINTNSAQYKAVKEKGWLSGVIENEMTMSAEERLIYEIFGGRDTIIKNLIRRFDGITRESVESTLVRSGNTLVRKTIDYSI